MCNEKIIFYSCMFSIFILLKTYSLCIIKYLFHIKKKSFRPLYLIFLIVLCCGCCHFIVESNLENNGSIFFLFLFFFFKRKHFQTKAFYRMYPKVNPDNFGEIDTLSSICTMDMLYALSGKFFRATLNIM